jgi:hypothetical protein
MPKSDFLDSAKKPTVTIDGDGGDVAAGSNGQNGSFSVRTKDGKVVAYLAATATGGSIAISKLDGKQAFFVGSGGDCALGGNGVSGDLHLYAPTSLAGGAAVLAGQQQHPAIRFAGSEATGTFGGLDTGGGPGRDGHILILNKQGKTMIHLMGDAGDITFANADLAEDFDVADPAEVEPGALMSLNADGKLAQSRSPYDRRVAGVISGAGAFRPGIILDRRDHLADRATLAVVGKAVCWVDATVGAIEVGDLLTTSATRGHAMKASDIRQAFGAVIGKALRPLREGRGLIPVLIALQ